MAGARRADARAEARPKDQQKLIAAQHHRLAVNRSHPALAKFKEAEKHAPDGWRA
jgi:hypothetical protein